MTKGGLWLDLTKIEHTFVEEVKEQMAMMREIPMGNHRSIGDTASLMQRIQQKTTARGAPAAENRLIPYEKPGSVGAAPMAGTGLYLGRA